MRHRFIVVVCDSIYSSVDSVNLTSTMTLMDLSSKCHKLVPSLREMHLIMGAFNNGIRRISFTSLRSTARQREMNVKTNILAWVRVVWR